MTTVSRGHWIRCRIRWPRICIALWLYLAALPLALADSNSLSLAEASRRALAENPELQVFQWRIQALDNNRRSAALRPEYALGFEAENFAGSGDYGELDGAELTLSLSSIIELGGKRQSRMYVADTRLALVEAERQAGALDLLGQVAQRFITALALQEKIRVARDASDLAETIHRLTQARVERGAVPRWEALRAGAALHRAQQRKASLQAELRSRLVSLSALWGGDGITPGTLEGDLYSFEPADSFDKLFERVASSPTIQVLASEARLRDAEVELARSQATGNLQWSIGFRRLEESDDSALVAGLSMPLFAEQRSRGGVAAAQARREITSHRKNQALLSLRARLYEAFETYQTSAAAAREMQETVLPLLRLALSQTREGFELGRYSYIDLVSTQQELIETRFAAIDAAATALLNQALIEQLTAEPLSYPTATTATTSAMPSARSNPSEQE